MTDWTRVRNKFAELITEDGSDCDFVLRTGETFTIKGAMVLAGETSMTEGIQEQERRLSIMANHWAAEAPADRHPEKGDQFSTNGQRFAIEKCDLVSRGGVDIGYRIRVQG